MEIYDPFQPTDGEVEQDGSKTLEEEEEGDKYDPFQPTGSPASEEPDDGGSDGEGAPGSASGDALNRTDDAEVEGLDGVPQDSPPYSTEAAASASAPSPGPAPAPATVPYSPQPPPRKRVLRDGAREQRRMRERREDSEHSEIEEGEIVGAGDKERWRERVEEVPGVMGMGMKTERILRVMEGDGFVSVCTEATWEDEPTTPPLVVGVGDLRRKLTSRRKERFRSCPVSVTLSPSPAPLPPAIALPSHKRACATHPAPAPLR